MSYDTITAFAVISFLLVMSPGPNGVLLLKTVPLYGKRSGINNIFGIFTATYVHGALSFFGLSAIILGSATLFTFIKIIGAVYLAFLGIKSLLLVIKSNEKNIETIDILKIKTKKNKSDINSYIEGFLTQILNPKVSIFYLAAFPQLIDFQNAIFLDIALLVSIHAFSILIWFIPFIFLLGKSSSMFQSNILQKFVQSFTGIVFLYFSYKILTVESKN